MENNTQWLSSFIKGKVLTETEKSALIGMPAGYSYEGYKFWHSRKCTHAGEKAIRVDYTAEYVFRLFKDEKMDGEYIKTDEVELTADEFADALK